MTTFMVILHIIVCLAVVMVVLLQTGKGAEMGATFGGGGSHTLFGSRGPGTFLTKMTAAAGAIFMLTSLSLTMLSTRSVGSTVIEEVPVTQEAPAGEAAPGAAPFEPAETPSAPPAFPGQQAE